MFHTLRGPRSVGRSWPDEAGDGLSKEGAKIAAVVSFRSDTLGYFLLCCHWARIYAAQPGHPSLRRLSTPRAHVDEEVIYGARRIEVVDRGRGAVVVPSVTLLLLCFFLQVRIRDSWHGARQLA